MRFIGFGVTPSYLSIIELTHVLSTPQGVTVALVALVEYDGTINDRSLRGNLPRLGRDDACILFEFRYVFCGSISKFTNQNYLFLLQFLV